MYGCGSTGVRIAHRSAALGCAGRAQSNEGAGIYAWRYQLLLADDSVATDNNYKLFVL